MLFFGSGFGVVLPYLVPCYVGRFFSLSLSESVFVCECLCECAHVSVCARACVFILGAYKCTRVCDYVLWSVAVISTFTSPGS